MGENERGFTLIELLVVIAIVAILAVVVVLTINPVELLKQSRDATRISDMKTLNSAIGLFLADGGTSMGSTSNCYTHATSAVCGGGTPMTGKTTVIDLTREVDGNGWIPIAFSGISSGSPLGILPIDPTNTTTYFYVYAPSTSNTFELNAKMESTRYAGASSVAATDGGNQAGWFEVGTVPSLAL